MNDLKKKEAIEYLYRSYTSVDGLWFMKTEELFGFEKALEIDTKVWRILPKIQSRFLKTKTNHTEGLEGLFECFKLKLKYDSFEFRAIKNKNNLEFIISRCPWYDLLIKSKRENISKKIGSAICREEYAVWAKEFGDKINLDLSEQLCSGCSCCRISYNIS
ncbi:MAG: DUF6125 family protein [Candidatus Humimicrobiaceae bacterium]